MSREPAGHLSLVWLFVYKISGQVFFCSDAVVLKHYQDIIGGESLRWGGGLRSPGPQSRVSEKPQKHWAHSSQLNIHALRIHQSSQHGENEHVCEVAEFKIHPGVTFAFFDF